MASAKDKEARTKLCPFMFDCNRINKKCVASNCMAWIKETQTKVEE